MIPPLARRFIAGETAAEAIAHADAINDDGVGAILNLLGEHYQRPGPANADTAAYRRLLGDLADADLRACISVKPTQLGLAVDESLFRENLARVLDRAAAVDGYVWVDMEGVETVDATLDAVAAHARAGDPVGVAIQANLRRTADDLERLAPLPVGLRLVKGAYDPPAAMAHQRRARIDAAYRTHLRYCFAEATGRLAVGTHDPAMLALAADLHAEVGTPYEVQMLMGVRAEAQRDLVTDRAVWQYAPYGERWLSYVYRRLTERRENVLLALRALLSR